MQSNRLIIILGPTASGKTKLAVALANYVDGEVISADSRQVFKGMDVGTGKDLEEYKSEGKKIPYHLIDIKNAGENYNVNSFKNDFYQALADITSRNKVPILCGGTGMYIHALLQNHNLTAVPVNGDLRIALLGYDREQLTKKLKSYPAERWAKADFSSTKRIIRAIEIAEYLAKNELPIASVLPINYVVIGLANEVDKRKTNILNRLNYRLANGLVEEVELLIANGVDPKQLIFYGLEYKFVVSYLSKEISLDTLKERLGIAICQYAKRQMTFFRKMEKDGVVIHWVNASQNFDNLKAESMKILG